MDAAPVRPGAWLMHRRSTTLIEDAMIAATAVVRDLIVVTRNTRHLEGFGEAMFNPVEVGGD